ncbi:hypothetical protein BC937DRAFT_94033 [Endogone sp. FLAS-F59071]|nr:hypothetical protein BC937DRAFT_94033 [Endogone sp. FLAS-F59071]|eukprot:RUS14302.1 hypothetical protein BC937DRAFT_94033 [Endogone sp. FLAS-F59071]
MYHFYISEDSEMQTEPGENNLQPEQNDTALGEWGMLPPQGDEQLLPKEAEKQIEEKDEGFTTAQSFWMFGTLIEDFQAACIALHSGVGDISVRLAEAEKALREIIETYLKMSIPPENLAPAIASYICENASATKLPETYLQHENSDRLPTDLLEVLLEMVWTYHDSQALREKMLRLIACIASKARRGSVHVVGGRLVVYLVKQLPRDFDGSLLPSAPPVLSWYRSYIVYVLYGNSGPDEADEDEKVPRLRQYLIEDMQCRAIDVPSARRHLCGQCRVLACSSFYDGTRPEIFGTASDYDEVLEPALEWEGYEQIIMWQFLNAELGGHVDKVEQLISTSVVVSGLESEHNPEPLPALLTLLRSVPPTSKILIHLIPMAFTLDGPISDFQLRFVLMAFEQWRRVWREPLESAVIEAIMTLDENIVEDDGGEEMDAQGEMKDRHVKRNPRETAMQMVEVLHGWWRYLVTSGRKEESTQILCQPSVLSPLRRLVEVVDMRAACPLEWFADKSLSVQLSKGKGKKSFAKGKSVLAFSIQKQRKATPSVLSGSDAGDGTPQDDESSSDEHDTLTTRGARSHRKPTWTKVKAPLPKNEKQGLLSPVPLLQAMAERTRSRSRSVEPSTVIGGSGKPRKKQEDEESGKEDMEEEGEGEGEEDEGIEKGKKGTKVVTKKGKKIIMSDSE